MDDESIFEISSSELDSLSDSADTSEVDPIDSEVARVTSEDSQEQGSDETPSSILETDNGSSFSDFSTSDIILSDGSSIVVRDDSSIEAITPVSSINVTMDNSEIITEMQRIEGYSISILYTLYILVSLLVAGFIIKMIFHFTSFDG